ncbi:MAG: adenylosuccinate lyase [Simkaniaceae bacterium]|nr:adenylosuccinate lyase [Candidatus Sacchlamyda saccharinae]
MDQSEALERYASKEMLHIFSSQEKYATWRKLWLALAKAEKQVGLPITDAQIAAMEKHLGDIDFARVHEIEKTTRHDVMAHLHAFAEKCPEAKGILHLGATSAFVTDNTDLLQMQKGLELLTAKNIELIRIQSALSAEYAALPTTGYTHFQPAQPTTVGKRICLWLQDIYIDTQDLLARQEDLHFLGVKGATGTQSSFMILLDHDSDKVAKLDALVAKEMGFKNLFTIAGQTYTRKQDVRILSALCGIATTASKCATDIRLLSHLGEMTEGRSEKQVGSSAMPHKHNPIYSERICGLARFLISLCQNPAYTHSAQWLERSLDDSANRRLVLPQAFLMADALLSLLIHLFTNLQIHPETIEKNLNEVAPALNLENVLMHAAKEGKDRQEIHEKLRRDPTFAKSEEVKIEIGRAKEQTETFLKETISPFLTKHKDLTAFNSVIKI